MKQFHSKNALIAHAGIDVPPYESGQFIGTRRRITKRGSSHLRRVGYEVMRCFSASCWKSRFVACFAKTRAEVI